MDDDQYPQLIYYRSVASYVNYLIDRPYISVYSGCMYAPKQARPMRHKVSSPGTKVQSHTVATTPEQMQDMHQTILLLTHELERLDN